MSRPALRTGRCVAGWESWVKTTFPELLMEAGLEGTDRVCNEVGGVPQMGHVEARCP